MKYKELSKMNKEDLDKKLSEMKLELMKLQAQVASGTNPKNPGQIRQLKRTVARLKTVQKTK